MYFSSDKIIFGHLPLVTGSKISYKNEMQLEEISFQYRGKNHVGMVAIPENIQEALETLSEREVYECFLFGYVEGQKKTIRAKRIKKHLKLNLEELTNAQKELLKANGLMR